MTELVLTKTAETASTVTLAWTPPVGAQGYVYLRADGTRLSSTLDGTKSSVKVAKSNLPVAVRALRTDSEGVYPPPVTPPSEYPATYTSGPLGTRNLLPVTGKHLLIENYGYIGDTWPIKQAKIAEREQAIGRMFDAIHVQYWSGGTTVGVAGIDQADINNNMPQWIHDRGQHCCVTWSPPYSIADVNAGKADQVFTVAANHFGSYGFPIMLRLWWEFDNTAGFKWSVGGTPNIGSPFVAAWRRVVSIFQAAGATNVGFWWCPLEGSPDRPGINASYPGDTYVDWVGSDVYNGGDTYDENGNKKWSSPLYAWWASFADCALYKKDDPRNAEHVTSQYDLWSARKPFVIGELGCRADPRKGDWWRNIPLALQTAPHMVGLSIFDQDVSKAEPGNDWLVDTSADSLAGFKQMAQALG